MEPRGSHKAALSSFTVIDFETTGSVAGWPVEPWQIGMVSLDAGLINEATYDSWLQVSPKRPFNHHAPGRHARLRGQLEHAPQLSDLWPQIGRGWLLNRPLVAHNIGTERSILRRYFPLHSLGPWIDTLRLVRYCYPKMPAGLEDVTYELNLLGKLKKLHPAREAHDALYDATACALLLQHFLSLPGWGDVSLQALIDLG